MGTWNYTVNDKFVEQYGPESASTFIRVLSEVAGRVRPGDRAGAADLLADGLGRANLELPKVTVDQLAENMTMAEHDRMVILDDRNAPLAEVPLPGSAGTTSEELRGHESPDDSDRPAYS